jgi:hypothetical protein
MLCPGTCCACCRVLTVTCAVVLLLLLLPVLPPYLAYLQRRRHSESLIQVAWIHALRVARAVVLRLFTLSHGPSLCVNSNMFVPQCSPADAKHARQLVVAGVLVLSLAGCCTPAPRQGPAREACDIQTTLAHITTWSSVLRTLLTPVLPGTPAVCPSLVPHLLQGWRAAGAAQPLPTPRGPLPGVGRGLVGGGGGSTGGGRRAAGHCALGQHRGQGAQWQHALWATGEIG